MNSLIKNGDFVSLVQGYRQKINLNPINFKNVRQNATRQMGSPLETLSSNFNLLFDFGLFYKKKDIKNINEIINSGV